jgi:hypothetical protein
MLEERPYPMTEWRYLPKREDRIVLWRDLQQIIKRIWFRLTMSPKSSLLRLDFRSVRNVRCNREQRQSQEKDMHGKDDDRDMPFSISKEGVQ